jgi:hypothetical protein
MLWRMKRGKSWAVLAVVFAVTNASANQAHDRIARLPQSQRNEFLTEFMSRSGDPCDVTKSFFQGFDERKAAFWSVACSNKKTYSIMLNDDGSNTILDCKSLKARSNVDCFRPF